MATKEQVYDAEIAPLMAKVIAICKAHKIAHVATFSLEPAGELLCTTCCVTEDTEPPEAYLEVVDILFPNRQSPLMLRVDHGDGTTSMNAIF